MDAHLKDKFDRVEEALGTLVDSITTNNPSPHFAAELNAADDELCSSLHLLSQHTANHARILALRAEAEALETQLKSSITTLASLRHELFETPATTFSEPSRPVPFDELLNYAKIISRYTVPPTYREAIPKARSEDKEREDGASSAMPSNGAGTPAIPNAPAAAEDPTKDTADIDGEAPKQVTPEQAEWLKKLNEVGHPWVPWPDNEKIRRGNLMAIQELLDRKRDPWTEKAAADKPKEDQEQDEPQAPVVQPAQPLPPMESIAPAAPVEQREPKMFTGFDDFGDS